MDRKYPITVRDLPDLQDYKIVDVTISMEVHYARDGVVYRTDDKKQLRGYERAGLAVEILPDKLAEYMKTKGAWNKAIGDISWEAIHSAFEVVEEHMHPPEPEEPEIPDIDPEAEEPSGE